MRRVDRRAFRRWVETLPAGEVVGMAGDEEHCPLAAYLASDPVAEAAPYVDGVTVRAWDDDGRVLRRLPPWAREFVDGVDGDWARGIDAREVTRERCLALLAEARGQ